MERERSLYTLGHWTVKAGKEDEFIAGWESFAKWTSEHYPEAGIAYLLRDNANAQQFISYGPWTSEEAVKAWRESPAFRSFAGKVRELCDEFRPRSLTVAATSG